MQKGFTLIELMVVVAILAILSAVTVPQMTKYFDRANDSKVLATISMLNTASATFAAGNTGNYASDLTSVIAEATGLPGGVTVARTNATTGTIVAGNVNYDLAYTTSDGVVAGTKK